MVYDGGGVAEEVRRLAGANWLGQVLRTSEDSLAPCRLMYCYWLLHSS